MALKLNGRYLRVEDQHGRKKIQGLLRFYADNTCESVFDEKVFELPLVVEGDAPNNLKQCYEYLKTLDEFKDATDC